MNELQREVAVLQQAVRRLQAAVVALCVGGGGLLFMAASPATPAELSVRTLTAEKLVLRGEGLTTTVTGHGLDIEAGTKDAGSSVSISAAADSRAAMRLTTWGAGASSSLHLESNRADARVAGVSNNNQAGPAYRGGAIELTTVSTGKQGRGPLLMLDETTDTGVRTGVLTSTGFAAPAPAGR